MKCSFFLLLLLACFPLSSCQGLPESDLIKYNGPESTVDREALFNYLLAKTLARESFSPEKNKRLQIDFIKEAEVLRKEFLAANTNLKLYRAILKFNNIRKDRHLHLSPVKRGLKIKKKVLQAPFLFAPEFSKEMKVSLFVTNIAQNVSFPPEKNPKAGEELIAINGVLLKDYFALMGPYLNHSTLKGLFWLFSHYVSKKFSFFGPELYQEKVTYQFKRSDGTLFDLQTPYYSPNFLKWAPFPKRAFSGFRRAFQTKCYSLYVPLKKKTYLLLDWHHFNRRTIEKDLAKLMKFAQQKNLLDHDLIIDATHSRGGSRGADLIRHISSKPFKTTFGNVRCSDITSQFGKRWPMWTPLGWWFRSEVNQANRAGKSYSPNVPFKLAHLPQDSDGIMQPAPLHFRGKLVCLFSSLGGSHLDQFAAMVIDNQLGHSIGMPTGGFSNTWEWEEVLVFPLSKRPILKFMWSIGHTIRPNGEILEGNPAIPEELIYFNRNNYHDYYDQLLKKAISFLEKDK